MSDHSPRPLAEMRTVAARLLDELRPYCERIETAGSIRRQAQYCRDIELVCIPRVERERDPTDLFRSVEVDRLDAYCRTQLDAGRFQHRRDKNGVPACGAKFKRLLVDGVALDLFCVLPPASWPVILLIRTGSADFSRRFVTQRWKGGALPNDCYVRDGAVWRGGTRLDLADEPAVFALCGEAYIEPHRRAA